MYLVISTSPVPVAFETVFLPDNALDSVFLLSEKILETLFWNAV
jgi:hypothetical protein